MFSVDVVEQRACDFYYYCDDNARVTRDAGLRPRGTLPQVRGALVLIANLAFSLDIWQRDRVRCTSSR